MSQNITVSFKYVDFCSKIYLILYPSNGNLTTNFAILLIDKVPYESPILGQLLNLISPPKINISEPRFKSYDPWDMAN